MQTKNLIFTVTLFALIAAAMPANAMILNFGVDIFDDGYSELNGFFNGDNTGMAIDGDNPILTLTINTSALFNGYTINSAYLFVDAVNIGFGSPDNHRAIVQGLDVGALVDTVEGSTDVPIITGPPSASVLSPYANDVDNSFYNLGDFINLNDLATDSTFTITFSRVSGSCWVDGINIQADVTPVVPEPASLSILGLGFFGLIRKFKIGKGVNR